MLLVSFSCALLRAEEAPSPGIAVPLRAGLRHLDGVRPRVYAVAFAPGGDLLVSASARFVRVWSLPEGRELRRFAERDGWMSAMVLEPDGESIITGGFAKEGGGFLERRSLADGRLLAAARTARPVSALALAGSVLAAGFSERSAAGEGEAAEPPAFAQAGIWSVAGGALESRRTFRGPRPGCSSVALTSDGKTLAWAAHYEGLVRIASLETGEILHTFADSLEGVTAVAFGAGGRELAIGSLDGFVDLVALEEGAPRRRIRWPTAHLEAPLGIPVRTVAWSPGGERIAASSCETAWDAPAVAMWSASTGELVREYPGGLEESHALAFSADGRLLAAGQSEGGVKVWEAASGAMLPPPGGRHRDRLLAAALSPGGERLLTSGRDGRVKLWAVPAAEVLLDHALPDGRVARAVAFAPDGRSLACLVAERDGGAAAAAEVHLLSAADGALLRRLEAMPDAWHLAWSAAGRLAIATGSHHESTGALRIYEGRTGELLEEAAPWPAGILSLAWERTGGRLALGTMDRVVALRGPEGAAASFEGHREDATPLRLLGALPCAVRALDWSPDGDAVASASFRTVRLWEPATGASRRLAPVHAHRVSGLAYDRAGDWLASSDLDGRVVLWEAATGQATHAWELGGAAKVLGWRGTTVVAVDAAGRAVLLERPGEGERMAPEALPEEAEGDKLTQGRLSAWVVARSTVRGRPFRNLIDIVQDTDGSFLVTDISFGLWRVTQEGQVEVLASGTLGGVGARAIAVLRDPLSSKLLVATRNSLTWLSGDGSVRSFLRGHELAGMERLVSDAAGDGWVVPNRENATVLQLSRAGRLTTRAASPLLQEVRNGLFDRLSAELTVTAGQHLLTISAGGDVRPLVRRHGKNPLNLANGLIQDRDAGDFIVVSEQLPGLYRVSRQGLLAHTSSLLSYPIGLAQERETGDLMVSKNRNFGRRAEGFEESAILRFSGFSRASDFEFERWLGGEPVDALPR